MTSIFGPRPDDRPPQHEEWSTGVTISIAAHLALIGALWWGIHWRSSSVEVASTAELWSAVPEAAAPPPVETPPPPPAVETPPPPPVETPRPPDIVTEQVKQKPPKPVPPPPPPPKPVPPKPAPAPPPPPPKLDAKALQKLHDENLKRMMGQMDAPATATGTAAHDSGPSASYGGRIIAALRPNVTLTDSVPGNPPAEIEIRCAPDGTIMSRRIIQSSGSKIWDDAVVQAIDKTGRLPRDTNGKALDKITITWRPQD